MSKQSDQALETFISSFLLIMVLFAVNVWIFMIVLGAAHSHVPSIPALGLVASAWVAVLIGILGQLFKPASGK